MTLSRPLLLPPSSPARYRPPSRAPSARTALPAAIALTAYRPRARRRRSRPARRRRARLSPPPRRTIPAIRCSALRAFRQAMIAGDMALAVQGRARARRVGIAAARRHAAAALRRGGRARLEARARAASIASSAKSCSPSWRPRCARWIAFGAQAAIRSRRCSRPTRRAVSPPAYAAEHRALLLIAMGKADGGRRRARRACRIPRRARRAAARSRRRRRSTERHQHDAGAGDAGRRRAPSVHAARAIARRRARCRARSIRRPPASASCSCASPPTSTRIRPAPLALEFARHRRRCSRPTTARPGWSPPTCSRSAGADQAGARRARPCRAGRSVRRRGARHAADAAGAHRPQRSGARRGAAPRPPRPTRRWATGRGSATCSTNAKQPADAAQAYDHALALSGGDKAPAEVAWPLLLQEASALLDAGDWPGAKAKATRALALAPQEPAVLNFLGYSRDRAWRGRRRRRRADRAGEHARARRSRRSPIRSAGPGIMRGDVGQARSRCSNARRKARPPKATSTSISATPIGRRGAGSMRAMPGARRWSSADGDAGGAAQGQDRLRADRRRRDRRLATAAETAYAKINLALHVRRRRAGRLS